MTQRWPFFFSLSQDNTTKNFRGDWLPHRVADANRLQYCAPFVPLCQFGNYSYKNRHLHENCIQLFNFESGMHWPAGWKFLVISNFPQFWIRKPMVWARFRSGHLQLAFVSISMPPFFSVCFYHNSHWSLLCCKSAIRNISDIYRWNKIKFAASSTHVILNKLVTQVEGCYNCNFLDTWITF